ncbi:putative holin-like toxin [Lactobacillus mellis]|nr:putative holin-like toxin [Bombilactobacillus mellis]NUF99095.1 putative holin-like toxin [Bombilactobacillus mellis]
MGGGRYGVKNHSHNYSKERRSLVSVKDALQLMLTFGNLIIALVTLIVQLTHKK